MQKQSRNVSHELNEGFDALQSQRKGKLTLRTVSLEDRPPPTITADEVVQAREKLRVSRGVFARYLRTNPRTLENWEQGRAKPNAQAALLIRMVARNPEIVKYLDGI